MTGLAARALASRNLASLESRNFRLYFMGQTVSMVGSFSQSVGLAMLTLDLTDSGSMLGLVTACNFVPVLVLGAWAGVVADRFDKRRLLMLTQLAMLTTAAILGVCVLLDRISIEGVFALALLTGVGLAFDNPVRRTFVSELVPEHHVPNAVSLNGALNNLAKLVGPALGGLLVSTAGAGWCFVVNAVSYLVVLAAVWMMDGSAMFPSPALPQGRGQVRAAFRHIGTTPDLRAALTLFVVVTILSCNWMVLLPLFATRDLDGGAGTYSVLYLTMSIGSLVGTLWLAGLAAPSNEFLGLTCVALGVSSLALAASPNLAVACIAGAAFGAAALIFINAVMATAQVGVRADMRGRTVAVFTMVLHGGIAVGGPFAGWVSQATNARVGFALAGAGALIPGAAVVMRRTPAAAPAQR